jgi:hypothetical protein
VSVMSDCYVQVEDVKIKAEAAKERLEGLREQLQRRKDLLKVWFLRSVQGGLARTTSCTWRVPNRVSHKYCAEVLLSFAKCCS